MKQVNLKLSVNEVNMVLKALGQFPYNQVYETVNKIHAQASEQVMEDAMGLKVNEDNQKNSQ
jgi:hypothetical protein